MAVAAFCGTQTSNWRFYNRAPSSSRSKATYGPTGQDFFKSFHAVLQRWQSETLFDSNPEIIMAHPSFQALVSNAQVTRDLIIKELAHRPSKLVWVLEAAFGVRPYSEDAAGDFAAMTDAWLAWAANERRNA